MRISYNVTGDKRKSLVGAISQELMAPIKYLGMPSASYEVGGNTITKMGELIGPDYRDLVANLQRVYGFAAVDEEHDEVPGIDLRADVSDAPDRLTIEMPLDGLTDATLSNLEKMVASKATLIRKALGTDVLPIERTEDKLLFPWFRPTMDGETLNVYARFIVALCAAAKAQKRVTAREKHIENEKFTFRVFLVRLGMVGGEYKNARRILLQNLTGNSAFRDGRPVKSEVITDE